MKPCWRNRGLTENGAKIVDRVLPDVMMLVQRDGAETVRIALEEAEFRVRDLPRLTPAYQKQYLNENE
jgi:hypothetical protein